MTTKRSLSNERGFTLLEASIIIAVLAIIGFIGYTLINRNKDDQKQSTGYTQRQPSGKENNDPNVLWENTSEGGWKTVSGTPPACPSPFKLQSPADLSKATALLYPGQERTGGSFAGAGGNYKPHGGFRFDGLKNSDVRIKSPIEGQVYRGSQYLVGGELQYTFDIIHPCGMMVRLGHLRVLSHTFQKYADAFPPAAEGDSRTERVTPFARVKAGDVVATSAGLTTGTNVFFDLGVYNLSETNPVAKTAAYQQAHADNKELAWHAVCWLDMLPKNDAAHIKSLPPGDPISGKKSDYCK